MSKIEGNTEAWETGLLGQDEEFAEAVKVDDKAIDDALELQMISIRMQKNLLDELKMIAELYGIGYQPLMKQILRRFVDCEKKQILRQVAYEQRKESEIEQNMDDVCTKEAC